MATTIQVQHSTAELLKKIKERTQSGSYDEAIMKLLKQRSKKSLAGFFARKKHYSRKEMLEGLRDERDRF